MVSGASLRLIGWILGCALIFGAGWTVRGWLADSHIALVHQQVAEAREQAAIATTKADREARKAEQAAQVASDAIAQAAEQKRRAQLAAASSVRKEIIRYVEKPGSARCALSHDWLRIHNQAAAGAAGGVSADAGAAGSTDDTAGTATDADALITITDNYGTCNQTRDELMALQAWVKRTRSTLNGRADAGEQ